MSSHADDFKLLLGPDHYLSKASLLLMKLWMEPKNRRLRIRRLRHA
jgi:hypothetical protein